MVSNGCWPRHTLAPRRCARTPTVLGDGSALLVCEPVVEPMIGIVWQAAASLAKSTPPEEDPAPPGEGEELFSMHEREALHAARALALVPKERWHKLMYMEA
jgi:hypothetical protein